MLLSSSTVINRLLGDLWTLDKNCKIGVGNFVVERSLKILFMFYVFVHKAYSHLPAAMLMPFKSLLSTL